MSWDGDAMFSGDWFARLGLLLGTLVLLASGVWRRAGWRWAGWRGRRGLRFVAGVVLGGAVLLGLGAIALRWLAGPEELARFHARLPDLSWPAAPPLPNVIRPTPQPEPERPRSAPPPRAAGPGVLDGWVSRVRDGDTIEVAGVAVRFANVDCAERGTVAGDAATRAMRELADGRQVRCDLIGRRSYDREIGTCYLLDGRDLGGALVSRGLCAWR
jgi:hypothetical protein